MSLRDAIHEAIQTGTVLDVLFQAVLAQAGGDEIARELSAMHNEGVIDVVAEFSALRRASLTGVDFFMMKHVFEKALPALESDTLPVMRCVVRLYREAGNDMTAGFVLNAFTEFLAAKESQPAAAISAIEQEPREFADLLVGAIVAGCRQDRALHVRDAIRMSKTAVAELRPRATFALGRINWPGPVDDLNLVIDALASLTTNESDSMLASVVAASIAISLRAPTEPRLVSLIEQALANGSDDTLDAASRAFGLDTGKLHPPLRAVLLSHLDRVKPTNLGTLRFVDFGVRHLLEQGDRDDALRLLEAMARRHEKAFSWEPFESSLGAIRSSAALASVVITRWLLRGIRTLCEGVVQIVMRSQKGSLQIDVDSGELESIDPVRVIFLARKAIGYLFFDPACAASVVVSLMRVATLDETREELARLLFDPLLVNYPGTARDFVIGRLETEDAHVRLQLQAALDHVEDYLRDIRSAGTLVALHPSTAQREAHHRFVSKMFSEAHAKAEA